MRDAPLDASLLDTALNYASRETRNHVADALACHLHNDGHVLEGNTEANDVEWFARNLYERLRDGALRWENTQPNVQDTYREHARTVLAVLPDFQLRVARRLITLSKVVRDIERAERLQRRGRDR
jgi:hypothetical protein